MIREEIEQIREAEEQALVLIRTAEKTSIELVVEAKQKVRDLSQKREKNAREVVNRMWEEMGREAEREAAALLADAHRNRDAVRAEMEPLIPKATDLIVQKILGETDVLSGTDE
ncbi:MAG: hypothetical protein JXA44_11180 [Methanospirillaceae archaeon]|nr:hypothetical protein [Methanospirillaceae archaeon]